MGGSMNQKIWKDLSDEQLAELAHNGMSGQGAIVESIRRHREMVVTLQRSATSLSRVMLLLAVVGIFVAIAGILPN